MGQEGEYLDFARTLFSTYIFSSRLRQWIGGLSYFRDQRPLHRVTQLLNTPSR